jgi:hypothetical protein
VLATVTLFQRALEQDALTKAAIRGWRRRLEVGGAGRGRKVLSEDGERWGARLRVAVPAVREEAWMLEVEVTWSKRLQKLLFNLLYPAVLGALFYDILLAGERADWLVRLVAPDRKLLVAALLVLLFMFDFMFTQEVRGYRTILFPLDILIVVFLFYGYTGIHLHSAEEGLDAARVILSLAVVYLLFLCWHLLIRNEFGVDWVLITYESLAAVAFLAAWRIGAGADWLAGSLMAGTIGMGVVGYRALKRYHKRSSPRPG